MHGHQCRKCGQLWYHPDRDFATVEERDAAHRCRRCGAVTLRKLVGKPLPTYEPREPAPYYEGEPEPAAWEWLAALFIVAGVSAGAAAIVFHLLK